MAASRKGWGDRPPEQRSNFAMAMDFFKLLPALADGKPAWPPQNFTLHAIGEGTPLSKTQIDIMVEWANRDDFDFKILFAVLAALDTNHEARFFRALISSYLFMGRVQFRIDYERFEVLLELFPRDVRIANSKTFASRSDLLFGRQLSDEIDELKIHLTPSDFLYDIFFLDVISREETVQLIRRGHEFLYNSDITRLDLPDGYISWVSKSLKPLGVCGEEEREQLDSIEDIVSGFLKRLGEIRNAEAVNKTVEYARRIIYFRQYIESENYIAVRRFVMRFLNEALDPLFSEMPEIAEKREQVIDHLSVELLKFVRGSDVGQTAANSWQDRVRESQSRGLSEWVELPSEAPARWGSKKHQIPSDKLKGEKPPDFIKRVYGPDGLNVLREDGTGLTQAALKQLDEHLYRALHNWLRNNDLPTDVPLPTKSEAISSEAARLGLVVDGEGDPAESERVTRLLRTLERRVR